MKDYTPYFTRKERADGTLFYCLADGVHHDTLQELLRSIHFDTFGGLWPSDWVYSQVYDAFERLAECSSEDDYESALSAIAPDVYTTDLIEWAKTPAFRAHIDEANAELGRPADFEAELAQGQWHAINAIYGGVWTFLQEHEREEE